MLGTIKVDKRTLLSNETLDDLLLLNLDKLPLEKFNPNPGINLWWSAKARRPLQKARKPRCKDQPSTSQAKNSEDSESEVEDVLHDWDDLIQSSGTEED